MTDPHPIDPPPIDPHPIDPPQQDPSPADPQQAGEKEHQRLSPLTPFIRGPILLLAFVGASWDNILSGDLGFTGLTLLVLLLAGAAYGLASWLVTKYWIDDVELRIDTGVLFRRSRRIRIDRLQGVDIVQPLLARLFGLAELRFDVAGGEREGSLAFLPHTQALGLRQLLLERRDARRGEPRPAEPGGWSRADSDGADGRVPGGPDPSGPDPSGQVPDGPVIGGPVAGGAAGGVATPGSTSSLSGEHPGRVLARLDLGRLLGSLALSSEMLLVLATVVVLAAAYAMTGSFAVVGGIVPAFLALGLALARRLTASYDFVVSESAQGLHITRGLTSLSSQTISLGRIQGIVVHEPLLWRRVGWAKLEVSVAGYESGQGDQAQASSVLMPVAPLDEVHSLAQHVLGRDVRSVPLTRATRRARWLAPLSAWTLALGQDDDLLVGRRGFWVRRLDVVPPGRVQSVRLSQGPVRRRLRLADVVVHSPPGPAQVRGPLCDEQDALAFVERAVESCRAARRSTGPTTAARATAAPTTATPTPGGGQPSAGVTPPRPETIQ